MKVPFQGRQVEATEVDFFTRKEDFNEYQLGDGSIIKMKTVVTAILKIEGELTTEGDPIYNLQSTNIVRLKK